MNEPATADAAQLIAPAEDRREFQRIALSMLVFVRLPEPPRLALGDSVTAGEPELHRLQPVSLRDLSMTGLYCYSALTYPLGAEIEMCLSLNGRDFGTAATIERRDRIHNGLYGYGLCFRQSRTGKDLRISLAAFLLRRDCRVTQSARR